jgi:hypothetical protein
MAMVLPIRTPRPDPRRTRRRRCSHPVQAERLVFPTANGEDHVSVLSAPGGRPRVRVQLRSIQGEAMQHAEVLLDRRQVRSILRLLGRAARRLDERPGARVDADAEAYRDEVACRAAEEWYEAQHGNIELPEDY